MMVRRKSTTGRITYFQRNWALPSDALGLIATTCLQGIILKINSFQAGVSKGDLPYEAQVEQLPELQLEQELPPEPGTRCGTPLTLVLNAAKVDILRREGLWHLGHSASCDDWLKGRICSNFALQAEQTYSYIGIVNLLFIV
jgi:hypothetical protein